MSCRPLDKEQLDSAPEDPLTPTKASRNDGTRYAYLIDEVPETESERDEELGAKKIRSQRHVFIDEVVKRWVTGERAKMDEDVIQSELDAAMRELMELS